jgi:hypothetical protein
MAEEALRILRGDGVERRPERLMQKLGGAGCNFAQSPLAQQLDTSHIAIDRRHGITRRGRVTNTRSAPATAQCIAGSTSIRNFRPGSKPGRPPLAESRDPSAAARSPRNIDAPKKPD